MIVRVDFNEMTGRVQVEEIASNARQEQLSEWARANGMDPEHVLLPIFVDTEQKTINFNQVVTEVGSGYGFPKSVTVTELNGALTGRQYYVAGADEDTCLLSVARQMLLLVDLPDGA